MSGPSKASGLAASAVDSGAARLVGAARFDACCLLGRRAQPREEASGGGGGRRGVAAGAEGRVDAELEAARAKQPLQKRPGPQPPPQSRVVLHFRGHYGEPPLALPLAALLAAGRKLLDLEFDPATRAWALAAGPPVAAVAPSASRPRDNRYGRAHAEYCS